MNRKQRRHYERKKHNIKQTKSFPEGTKVVLNFDRLILQNPKRNQWCKEHRDKILTIEKAERFKETAFIYTLKEDETDPKWYFSHYDLMTLENYLKTKEKVKND